MYGLLLSAANGLLGFVFRSIIVKFVLYFALFFVVTEFIQVISPLLPTATGLSNSLGGLPSGVWYFLDLFNVSYGIPTVVSAMTTRFLIRRLPVIG